MPAGVAPSRKERIDGALRDQLNVNHLEIINESAQHAGHYSGDGETHWRLFLVSTDFEGLSRLQRHQKINELLKEEFERGLHALTLKLLTPTEWANASV